MDRLAELLKFIAPGQKGIEIGPYFNPLVPKSAGWDVLILDVFDTGDLLALAKNDPNIAPERLAAIEPVDLVGPAHRVAELAEAKGIAPGSIDFVISSHNIEHLPDPIRFFKGVSCLLRPGGVLSMAIPDCRYCFDAVRPTTGSAGFLEAYLEAHERPSPRQEFESNALFATCRRADGSEHLHFVDAGENATPILANALPTLLGRWQARLAGTAPDYRDVHCWTLTPASFAAILTDLRLLGLSDLEVREISPTNGIEFYAHLIKPVVPAPASEQERVAAYTALLHESRAGAASPALPPPPPPEIVRVPQIVHVPGRSAAPSIEVTLFGTVLRIAPDTDGELLTKVLRAIRASAA
jgi:SAM-dependent methyltransferase